MRDYRWIQIGEHESVTLARDSLQDKDLRLLQRLADNRVLDMRVCYEGWQITARSIVGQIQLSKWTLAIVPKVAFAAGGLPQWYLFAEGMPVKVAEASAQWKRGEVSLPDLAAAALIAACQTLTRDGLRRDYRAADVVSATIRGRVDVKRQISQRYGQVDQVYQRSTERTTAIWENAICATALRYTGKLIGGAAGRAAMALAAQFGRECRSRPETLALLHRARYHRMNQRYKLAHAWAAIMLGQAGITAPAEAVAWPGGVLLIGMNQLWERIVTRLIKDAADATVQILRQPSHFITVAEHGFSKRPLRPDLVTEGFSVRGHRLTAVDAKYKTYAGRAVSSSDIHQMLTYAVAFADDAVPEGMVLFPSPAGGTHRLVKVFTQSGVLAEVDIVGIDTSGTPAQAVSSLRSLMVARAEK